jgi:hypothetical protein
MPRRFRVKTLAPARGFKKVRGRVYPFYYMYLYIPKRLGETGKLTIEYDEHDNKLIIRPAT